MPKNKVTIMDGGMGRLLKEMGAPFRQPEWSALALMEAPDYVTQAHDAFLEAGAEIIITNSYAVVPFHIGQERFDQQGRALIKLSAEIARTCADKALNKVLVAGSIPPAFGSYRADLFIEEKAADIYRPMIEEQAPYVDFWLAETVATIREAHAIKAALGDSPKPFWISYTVRDRQEAEIPPQLRSGESIEEAVNTAIELNAACILLNCSQPEEMAPVLEIIQGLKVNIPYGVYANAFEPIMRDQGANQEFLGMRDENSSENYLKFAQTWRNKGASVIGGCCGIMPEHIKELSKINN